MFSLIPTPLVVPRRLLALLTGFSLIVSVLSVVGVATPQVAERLGNVAGAQAACPPGATLLTEFNWSAGPGGNDDPATDGATWPADTVTKTWANVGASGLDVTVTIDDPFDRNIDTAIAGQPGGGSVGTVDNIPTSTNEDTVTNDGFYGSDYLTWAIYSQTSDEPVTLRFDFNLPVFFATDFSVDDLDSIGLNAATPTPSNSFQDEIDILASDGSGPVLVNLIALGNAVTVGQSATANYEVGVNNNVAPDDLAGQITITTPKPFTSLSIEYSNGPDDQAAEIADPNNDNDWDGVNNGQAVRLGGFELCLPDDAGIDLDKTVYGGHDAGASCAGGELLSGVVPGEDITYCFLVTNTGDTYLSSIEMDDPALGLSGATLTPVSPPSLPLAPGATAMYYLDASAPAADLVNSATANANPVYPDGSDIPFQNDVDATDTAEVDVDLPAIELVKSVYVGHDAGAGCPGAALASAPSGTSVTYCFAVQNTGAVPLASVVVDDATLGNPTISATTAPFAEPLLPGETVTFYFETTSAGDLTNTADVTAVPSNPSGTPIPDATPVTDSAVADIVALTSGITLQKTVVAGNLCPGAELVTVTPGTAISYCFEIENTGTTHLADVVIDDADIAGFDPSNLVAVSGSLVLLPPGETAVVRYPTVATADLLPNTATATGTPADNTGSPFGPDTVDDSDTAGVEVVVPAITIVKTAVVAGDPCPGVDATVLTVASGLDVTYCFTVTNTGETSLTSIGIDDPDLGITGLAVPDLDPGDSATVASADVAATDLVNTATVTGIPVDAIGNELPGAPTVTDDDTAEVDTVTPGINLDKTVVAGTAATACPGAELVTGGNGIDVTYCFVITNTGDSFLDLAGMTFGDADLGITAADLTPVGAITDPLPPAATATYAYTTTLTGDLLNTASVTADPVDAAGNPVPGAGPVDDTDTAAVDQNNPAVSIVKTVYAGHDAGAACGGVNAITVDSGDAVTYCFVVTNTSTDAHLADVEIDDTTLGVAYPGTIVLLNGDPALLAPGESFTAYYEATATTDLTNTASTTGTPADAAGNPIPVTEDPTAQDDALVDVVAPAITVEKTVYNGHDAGGTCPGGEIAQGSVGADITWCFVVQNTGDVFLTSIEIADPDLGITLNVPGPLAPGATATVFHEGQLTGDVVNTATVTGDPSDAVGSPLPGVEPPSDSDTAETEELNPALTLDKAVYDGVDSGAQCATATTADVAVAGADVTWCFTVTNTGNTHLSAITVFDPALGLTGAAALTIDGPVAPGDSATVFFEGTAPAGTFPNVATATGNPTDATGTDLPGTTDPSDTGDAVITGLAPAITIAKTVSLDGTCPGTDLETTTAGTAVSYCFAITNSGDTHLSSVAIDDDIYGALDATNTAPVTGALALIAPGETVTVRYDTTAPGADQTNTADATGSPATAGGTPLDLPAVTSAPDIADLVIVGPALTLIKTVVPAGTACDGVDNTTLEVADGSDVTYCFTVTNTGDIFLTSIEIADPDLGITALAVPGPIAPGDSGSTSFGPVAATDLVNTASASGTPADAGGTPLPGIDPVTDSDQAIVDVLTPAITLAKTVVPGAAACPGTELVTGDTGVAVTYCFTVTNTGDSFLTSIEVADPDLGITALAVPGPLAPGDSATVSFATTLDADLVNTATVSADPTTAAGDPLPGSDPVTDSDTAEVSTTSPSFILSKTVYEGHDGAAGCPGGELVTAVAGTSVTYCFLVSNTSADTPLTAVSVDDPDVGPITLVAAGDPNLVPPGGSVMFYVETTMPADLVNTATPTATSADATGNPLPGSTPTDGAPDTAEVEVIAPGILLAKTVYAGHDAGASCAGTELASGTTGAPATYCFTVTNTGDTHLSSIEIADPDLGITALTVPGPLAPGDSATIHTDATITTDLTNTATVNATPSTPAGAPIPDVDPVTDTDTAQVDLIAPGILLAKTVSVDGNCPGTETATITSSDAVTWCFTVTNTGDTHLSAVALNDPTLGITDADMTLIAGSPSPLATGATATFTYTAVPGVDTANTATVTADPASPDGTPLPSVDPVTDSDTADVAVVAPALTLAKTVSVDGTCPGVETVEIAAGAAPTWCFTVTNTGDTHLSPVSIQDPDLGVTPVLSSGTLPLAPGEDLVFVAGEAETASFTNTATATGTPTDPAGTPLGLDDPSAGDTASVLVLAPAVTLDKTVSANGTCPGVDLLGGGVGIALTYCFTVTNTGTAPLDLAGMTFGDPALGIDETSLTPVGTPPALLLPGANFTYSYSGATLPAGGLVNTAAVSLDPTDSDGDPLVGPGGNPAPAVGADDSAEVTEEEFSITLLKTVYADHDAGASCDGANAITVDTGAAVTYCFTVTNASATAWIANPVIDDPALGLTALAVPGPLAPGASATVYVDETAAADLLNTATATGEPTEPDGTPIPVTDNPTATDTASVDVVTPGILLTKTVYAGHDAGGSCAGTELALGTTGDPATWCFTVTNTGDSFLTSVAIQDPDLGITGLAVPGPIAPGDAATVHVDGTITTDLTNTATVDATPSDPAGVPLPDVDPVTDDDTAAVDLVTPAIIVTKTVYLGHDAGAGCPGMNAQTGVSGDAITWCVAVANTGDTHLSSIELDDPVAGLPAGSVLTTIASGALPLAPGDSIVYFIEDTATADVTNVVTATATPSDSAGDPLPPTIESPTGTDSAAVDIVGPAMTVNKTVSTDGSCPGVDLTYVDTGDALTYCFSVLNAGDTHLSPVALDDPTLGITDADMTLVSGTTPLAPGTSLTYTYATTGTTDVMNTVFATAQPSTPTGAPLDGVDPIAAADTAEVVVPSPGIALAKTVSVDGTCPGTELVEVAPGTAVTWCLTATNTGDTHLSSMEIVDPTLGIDATNQAVLATPDPADVVLAPGAVVSFTVTAPVAADLTNTATINGVSSNADGTPLPGTTDPVTDTDTASVDVLTPAITVAKTVSVDGMCPGVESVEVGADFAVTWCITATNSGETPLTNLVVDDPAIGIDGAAAIPVAVVDADNALPLDPGGIAYFEFPWTADADLLNTVTVTADPTTPAGDPLPGPDGLPAPSVGDDDPAEVLIIEAGLAIVKTAYVGSDGGAGCPGTDPLSVAAGTAITWCFTVTNTSSTVALADVTVDDPTLGLAYPGGMTLVSGDPALLAPGASAVFSAAGTATIDIENTASATGTPSEPDGTPIPTLDPPTADDSASIDVVAPAIAVVKTVSTTGQCPGVDEVVGQAGLALTWCFQVTNTGDTHLAGVEVLDPVLNLTLTDPTLLAPGDSVTLSAPGELTGDLVNTASAIGTPADPAGTPLPDLDRPTADDDAAVDLVDPGVDLVKRVYAGHDAGAGCASATANVTADHGAPITWCFIVTNTGDTHLSTVAITDGPLAITDADLTIVSGALPLAPGDSIVYRYEDEVDDTVENTATVTAGPVSATGTSFTDVDDPTDISTATVTRTPFDLVLTKSVRSYDTNTRRAIWTITVVNDGPGVAPGPITITDPLPAALTYVSAVGSAGTCTAAGQDVTCISDTDLAVGATLTITLTTDVSAAATGSIDNDASVTAGISDDGTGEDRLDNNDDGDTIVLGTSIAQPQPPPTPPAPPAAPAAPPSRPTAPLARTGATTYVLLQGSGWLILAGAALVALARRRDEANG